MIFTEPLFTIVLSFLFLRTSIGFSKMIMCLGLLCGMMLSIQPPFIFGEKSNSTDTTGINSTTFANATSNEEKHRRDNNYYFGVTLALSCAIFGSMCNILINKCEHAKSTVLVFYSGISGVIVSIIGLLISTDALGFFNHLASLSVTDWVTLSMISIIGILGYFSMTVALRMVSPTSVSVLRALEIILAYLCQIIVMQQMPNKLCVLGSTLVMMCVVGIAIAERSSSSNNNNNDFWRPRSLQIGRTFIVNPSTNRQILT